MLLSCQCAVHARMMKMNDALAPISNSAPYVGGTHHLRATGSSRLPATRSKASAHAPTERPESINVSPATMRHRSTRHRVHNLETLSLSVEECFASWTGSGTIP